MVALLREKRLAVAWLGDSLAVLVRKRQPVKLVEPHKPDLQVMFASAHSCFTSPTCR